MYLITSFFWFLVGGLMALMIRRMAAERHQPEPGRLGRRVLVAVGDALTGRGVLDVDEAGG